MTHTPTHVAQQSTRTDIGIVQPPKPPSPKEACEAKGGFWDEERSICILAPTEPVPEPEPPRVDPNVPEILRNEKGDINGVILPDGRQFLGISQDEVNALVSDFVAKQTLPEGAAPVGTTQRQADIAFQGQQLAGQVGAIQPSTGITPTNLSQTEALTQGTINAIPSALRLAGQAGLAVGAIGAVGGTAVVPGIGTTIGAVGGAIIGGAIGLVAGITQGIISNMGSQRRDNTTAQQRTLDEGKQTLQDWATLAASDPSNRQEYLTQFNRQLQLIQDAHVQMLTDTNADVAKFETAIPNLAEFNSFYSVGGERDALVVDMQNALTGGILPQEIDFRMLTLTKRRG